MVFFWIRSPPPDGRGEGCGLTPPVLQCTSYNIGNGNILLRLTPLPLRWERRRPRPRPRRWRSGVRRRGAAGGQRRRGIKRGAEIRVSTGCRCPPYLPQVSTLAARVGTYSPRSLCRLRGLRGNPATSASASVLCPLCWPLHNIGITKKGAAEYKRGVEIRVSVSCWAAVVPLGAVPVLSWCGEVSLDNHQSSHSCHHLCIGLYTILAP